MMGKGVIVSNQEKGKYKITLKYKTDYAGLISKLTSRFTEADKRLVELELKKETLRNEINSLQDELSVLLLIVPIDTQKVNELTAKITGTIAGYEKAIKLIVEGEIKKLGIEKQLDKVKELQVMAGQEIDAWCVTYSDQLSGDIDTIEIDDQSGAILIAPEGHTEIDGQLKHTILGSSNETFYNFAMLPGVQKWRPRYKFGKILTVDRKLNLCKIELEETSQTGLDTLVNDVINNVPVEYLKCNAAVFSIDDEVVVEFKDREIDQPRVIGFKDNPRSCLSLLLVQVRAAGYSDYILIWNMAINAYHTIPSVTFPCKSSLITEYLATVTEIGWNLFLTEDAGFAIEDWEDHDYDCHIDTPSNQTCHKEIQVACTIPGHDGKSVVGSPPAPMINTREVDRIGAYSPNWYTEIHYIWDVIPLARRRDLQPTNLPYEIKLYKLYDVPFPAKKITAQNDSGYIGSAGTKFSTARTVGSPPEKQLYPWIFVYRHYYMYKKYEEYLTKQYQVLTPLGEMFSAELKCDHTEWNQSAGGGKKYVIKAFDKVQGIIGGQYTEPVFTQLFLMQHVEKITQKTRTGNEEITYQNRVVTAQAQTIIGDQGSGLKTSPYNSLGRNAELEAAVQNLVAAWYTGNGLSINSLFNIGVDWKMIS